jgi:hypothetical protein
VAIELPHTLCDQVEEGTSSPIFVFGDGLSVHRSLRAAGIYHEFRETLRAFNRDGAIFELPPSSAAAWVWMPGGSRKELVRKLRREVIRLAIDRPDRVGGMTKWQVKHAPDEQIIEMAVRWFSIQTPSRRLSALDRVGIVLLSPILVVLFVLLGVVFLIAWVFISVRGMFRRSRAGGGLAV